MSQNDIVSPVSVVDTSQCTIIPPWFVEGTEYPPALATYKPLVNGEEAFRAVHEAIANAKKTVDIICWGFQPSMYFIRDGQAPCIGELLINLAQENKVQVRILGWEMFLNATGLGGEANLPGYGLINLKNRAGQTSSDDQYTYDKKWFSKHLYSGGMAAQALRSGKNSEDSFPIFVGRGFDANERAEIAYQASRQALDKSVSGGTVFALTMAATHHQKTVLIDYELPEHAVGFVMGHNMLDEYWDTDKHSSMHRPSAQDHWEPYEGPRGFLPRQDISSRVTGPILEHLHENFATAWCKETGEDLIKHRNAKEVAKKLKTRAGFGTPIMAQLLRTQAQEGKRDIEKLYLKTVNNATQFIYIENQYFRWPPLAEAIKNNISAQIKAGRVPEKDGSLYLFVITNVTDEGIGAGTVNTQRMLESLGRADTIPNVTKEMQVGGMSDPRPIYYDPRDPAAQEKLDEYEKEIQKIRNREILQVNIPGLKVHICSLVAPDSPEGNWMPVYVHSKLMIINDVFTTHGSANINTRSMQVDSEMNIAHDWASVTKALRQRLWKLHTNGIGMQDDPTDAFRDWGYLLGDNEDLQGTKKDAPKASLIKFLYSKVTLKDQD
ncbi:phospholipase [Rahnella sp. C60]|uniref:phospholipase D-like domain-containing protein n=2 Tax=Rahnella perminowiae TaxID=2816244 RepID=UPI001C25F52C|nr:phospholipase D-like domain-containing protein [Rahnella perminowiae]MBU9815432.1 phospholipase [Rahnella perminowiae]